MQADQAAQAADKVNNQGYAHDHAEIKANEHRPTGSSSREEAQGRDIEPGRAAAERALKMACSLIAKKAQEAWKQAK